MSTRPPDYPASVSKASEEIGIPDGREVDPRLAPYIKPHKQDFEWMTQGAEVTLAEVSAGHWPTGQGRQFLKTFGICTEVEDAIVRLGNARNKKRKADEMYDSEKDSVIPAIWSMGYDLSVFIECPMYCKYSIICSKSTHHLVLTTEHFSPTKCFFWELPKHW